VRKSLYFNFEHYKAMGMHAFQNDDDILRLHVSTYIDMNPACDTKRLTSQAHCLDTVRQVLMCNVDTSILGQVWVNSDKPTAFPDFNTRHMCKNFDAIKAWAGKVEVRYVEVLAVFLSLS
jgi:hypothetical protein